MFNWIRNIIKSWKKGVYGKDYQTDYTWKNAVEDVVDNYLIKTADGLRDGISSESVNFEEKEEIIKRLATYDDMLQSLKKELTLLQNAEQSSEKKAEYLSPISKCYSLKSDLSMIRVNIILDAVASVVNDENQATDELDTEKDEIVPEKNEKNGEEDADKAKVFNSLYHFEINEIEMNEGEPKKERISGYAVGKSDAPIIECDIDGNNFVWYSFSQFGEEKFKDVIGNEEGLMNGVNTFLRKNGYPELTAICTPEDYRVQCGYTEGELEYFRDCE